MNSSSGKPTPTPFLFFFFLGILALAGYFLFTDTYFERADEWCLTCGQFADHRYYHIGPVRFFADRGLAPSEFADILAGLRGPCPKHVWRKHHGGGTGIFSNISDSCHRPSFWGYFKKHQVSRFQKIAPAILRAFMEDVLEKDRDESWKDDEEPKVFAALSDVTTAPRAEAFQKWWESEKRSPITTPDYWDWIVPIRVAERQSLENSLPASVSGGL